VSRVPALNPGRQSLNDQTPGARLPLSRLAEVFPFKVRTVTNPAGARAGCHGDRAVIPANFLQCEVAPCVSHTGNRIAVLLRNSGLLGKQLFVPKISTRLERHNSTGDSGESPADQRLSNGKLVTVMGQGCRLRRDALRNGSNSCARQLSPFDQWRFHPVRYRCNDP
jgi:hypothetical protein